MSDGRARVNRVLLGFVWGGLIYQSVAGLVSTVVADILWLAIAIVGAIFAARNMRAAR